MSKGRIGTSTPKRSPKAAKGSFSHCGVSLRGFSPPAMSAPSPQARAGEREEFAMHPRLGCSARGAPGSSRGDTGELTYVRVAEGFLGVGGRACARLGAPVPQAPGAQEHDEPEPGSHRCCRGHCSPLQSCRARRQRGCCSRRWCTHRTGQLGPRRAALRVPKGDGSGAARRPWRWRTTLRAGGSGSRSGSWSRSWSSRRRSRPRARSLPALRRCSAAE